MPSNKKLLILPGDGIGPEVMKEVLKIIEWMSKNISISFDYNEYNNDYINIIKSFQIFSIVFDCFRCFRVVLRVSDCPRFVSDCFRCFRVLLGVSEGFRVLSSVPE